MPKTTRQKVTPEQFEAFTRPLIGLPISRTWRGHGSAIFLEMGQLSERVRLRKDGSQRITHWGEFTVMIEWSWRVERARSVSFGSWSTTQIITNRLSKLQGLEVVQVAIEGRLPEITLQLSGGHWLRSFTTTQGQPRWCLFFNNSFNSEGTIKWIHVENGGLWKQAR